MHFFFLLTLSDFHFSHCLETEQLSIWTVFTDLFFCQTGTIWRDSVKRWEAKLVVLRPARGEFELLHVDTVLQLRVACKSLFGDHWEQCLKNKEKIIIFGIFGILLFQVVCVRGNAQLPVVRSNHLRNELFWNQLESHTEWRKTRSIPEGWGWRRGERTAGDRTTQCVAHNHGSRAKAVMSETLFARHRQIGSCASNLWGRQRGNVTEYPLIEGRKQIKAF